MTGCWRKFRNSSWTSYLRVHRVGPDSSGRISGAADGIFWHRKDLDERVARRLGEREDSHRFACHPLWKRGVRGCSMLRHATWIGLLSARRAYASPLRFGQDLPHGADGRSVTLTAAFSRRFAPMRSRRAIRPIVYRGYNTLGVDPSACPVDSAILTWEWGAYLGKDALERGADVAVSSWTRAAANTFPSLAKSSANYANSQLIKMAALADGYSEGIALDTSGYLSGQRSEHLPRQERRPLYAAGVGRHPAGNHAQLGDHHRAGSGLPGARRAAAASFSTSPMKRSSWAPPSKSRRSAQSTRSSLARAGAGRSPRRSRPRFSTSSTASDPTRTVG